MRAWVVTFVASVVIAVAVLLDLTAIVEAQSGSCRVGAYLYNRNRKIGPGGRINAECPGGIHSHPFGNWGVQSSFGAVINENQFKGWHQDDGHHQWNSCTTHPYYQAPNPMYYNRPIGIGRWQEGDQTEERVNKTIKWLETDSSGESCRALWDGRSYTVRNVSMRLLELDRGAPVFGRNSHVATLYYGDVQIRLQCSSTWTCEGKTDWMQQRSVDPPDSRVSAEAYIVLKTARR